jgi:PKD repeat protein
MRLALHLRFRLRAAAVASTALVALAAAAGLAASARGATYTVGTPSDLTGTCSNPASGTCSLRQLIEYENALPSAPNPIDVIIVPGGTYDLTNGELPITQSLAIVGAGARTTNVDVPEQLTGRVFDVTVPKGGSTPTVLISGLEISGGNVNESNGSFGGDVYNSAQLDLDEDWITGGNASSGGGVSNDTGTLVVQRSLISNNHAGSGGGDSGAIQNHGSEICTTACFPGKSAILDVENSTIADNDARLGGGIFSWSDAEDSNQVTILNSTIVENTNKAEPSGPARGPGAGLLISDGSAQVANTILAFNDEINEIGNFVATNCSTLGSGKITSLGYNLDSGTDCGFQSTGDKQSTFPEFTSSSPQNNGGNTDTFALEPTSPAVDAIPSNSPFCFGTDQRGVARPQGLGCDIGSFELVPFTIQATEGIQFSGQVAMSPSCGIETRETPKIEWGDGQTSEGTVDENEPAVNGTHTYAKAGTYHGTVTYVNDCGTHKVAFQAQVANALTATGVPVDATAGVQFSATVATFTDAASTGTASDYTATIAWGDGTNSTGTVSTSSGGSFAVTGSHTYASSGVYQTTVTISNVRGATTTAVSGADVTSSPAPPAPPPPAPPTLLATSPPSITTTTSATFSTTVNPHGLATSVHFEYGPVLGAGAAAIAYGSVTPDQQVAPDFANHTITATVTGLLPNVTYHVRAVATNSAGSAQGADQTLTTPADPPPPPPVLGKSVNVTPVSGIVYIELPPGAKLSAFAPFSLATQAFAALTKGQSFIPLTEARQIPVGSILEATAGVAGITTATTASKKGKLQSGDFGAGIFKLLQQRRQRGLTELDIIDNHSARQVCATQGKGKARTAATHPSSKVLGRLNASGHGHFTARGQYSAATVRGTVWSVVNRCDGTLTRVTRGVISVRDFRRRKTLTLFTGQSYLARPPHH